MGRCCQYDSVNDFHCNTGWLLNADIFFVLDVSASIKQHNFETVQTFEYNFVKKLAIGPNDNQVGTITFDDDADLVFKLNSHHNKRSLLRAINDMEYYRPSFTNIKDALCKVKEGFTECNGARSQSLGVLRVAILLTDGRSNVHNSSCGWDTIDEAAAAVHALNILVYVIAVGDEVNYDEIYAIASPIPGAVANLTDFDPLTMREEEEEKSKQLNTEGKSISSLSFTSGITNSGIVSVHIIQYNILSLWLTHIKYTHTYAHTNINSLT